MRAIGIRGQLIIMVTTAVVVSVLTAAVFVRDMVYENVLTQKRTTANVLTESIVHDIKYEYNYRNRVAIDNIISKYLTYYRIINKIHYYAVDSSTIVDGDKSSITVVGKSIELLDPQVQKAILKAKPSLNLTELKSKEIAIRSIAPVLQGSRVIGAITIDIAIDDVNQILSDITKSVFTILVIVTLVAGIIVFAFLQTSLLSRLKRLMVVTRDISVGNYQSKLNDDRKDELGQLASAFDQMTEELHLSRKEIENHNQILDQKVKDATSELQIAYEDLKEAQTQIVLSEKMASLGVLISGVAHEINTPVSSIANTSRHLTEKVESLPGLIELLVSEQGSNLPVIKQLLDEIIIQSGADVGLPSFKDARQIEMLFKNIGIEDYREKVSVLSALNFVQKDRVEHYIDILKLDSIYPVLEAFGFIAQTARISKTSTKKIQDIVQALKFYAYTDKDKVEATQINDSIKTSLVLISNRMKHLLTVDIDLDETLPEVPCTCEIHQVWTVLLNNSVDAIEQMGSQYQGTINIRSYRDNGSVYVSVKDNGGGIPKHLLKKIFDPFFTTKDIGAGTGLGLSIVSGIVKKHGGDIQVETENKTTTFLIRIPFEGIELSDEAHLLASGK